MHELAYYLDWINVLYTTHIVIDWYQSRVTHKYSCYQRNNEPGLKKLKMQYVQRLNCNDMCPEVSMWCVTIF
jgi:hypothetical protein